MLRIKRCNKKQVGKHYFYNAFLRSVYSCILKGHCGSAQVLKIVRQIVTKTNRFAHKCHYFCFISKKIHVLQTFAHVEPVGIQSISEYIHIISSMKLHCTLEWHRYNSYTRVEYKLLCYLLHSILILCLHFNCRIGK